MMIPFNSLSKHTPLTYSKRLQHSLKVKTVTQPVKKSPQNSPPISRSSYAETSRSTKTKRYRHIGIPKGYPTNKTLSLGLARKTYQRKDKGNTYAIIGSILFLLARLQ